MPESGVESWYSEELRPWNWTKPLEDHPWLVEAARRSEAAHAAGDLRGQVEAAWDLGKRTGRALLEHLGLTPETQYPALWVRQARETVDARIEAGEAYPLGPIGTSQVATLHLAMWWMAKMLREPERISEVADESPFGYADGVLPLQHLTQQVTNAALQLLAAMAPERSRPTRRIPSNFLERAHGAVVTLLASPERDVTKFMNAVIDASAELVSGPWETFREIDYAGDLAAKRDSVIHTVAVEPPEAPLRGLWFGLSNPIYEGLTTADMYFFGAHDPHRTREDWIFYTDYEPAAGALRSTALSAIYDGAYRHTDLGSEAHYPLVLAYGGLLARECAERYAEAEQRSVRVTFGFDSGDPIDLGWLGPQ